MNDLLFQFCKKYNILPTVKDGNIDIYELFERAEQSGYITKEEISEVLSILDQK